MRIVGLDIGETSIRAVEIDTAFGRYEIHDYHEVKISPDQRPAAEAALLIRTLRKKPDRLALTVPGRQVTFRNITLPTKDRKAAQSALLFELEDELPFELEKCVWDSTLLSQSSSGTTFHIAAALLKNTAPLVGEMVEAGIDPDILTTESWAFRTLLNRSLSKENQEKPVLVIDIGRHWSSLYLHWKNRPVLARDIPWGGDRLTSALVDHYRITSEEAEKAKLSNGFVLNEELRSKATQDQIEFSDVLSLPLQSLVSDAKQVILSGQVATNQSAEQVFLAGRTSLLPGLAPLMAELTGLRASSLRPLSALSTTDITYSEETDAVFGLAAASALTLVGQERSIAINLRRGPLAKDGARSQFGFQAVKKPLIAATTVFACLMLSLVVESNVYEDRLVNIEDSLRRTIRSVLGNVSRSGIRNYMSRTSSLKKRIKNDLDQQRELARLYGENPNTPLDYLLRLSDGIPKSLTVDLLEFVVGQDPTASYGSESPAKVTLTFLVANPQTAEKLAIELKALISDLKRGKTEEAKSLDGKEKRWKVTFTGEVASNG